MISPSGSGSPSPQLRDLGLDPVDDLLGLLLPSMDEEPARTLGDVAPHDQDPHAQDGAEANASRQPTSVAKMPWSRNSSAASAADAGPTQ